MAKWIIIYNLIGMICLPNFTKQKNDDELRQCEHQQ